MDPSLQMVQTMAVNVRGRLPATRRTRVNRRFTPLTTKRDHVGLMTIRKSEACVKIFFSNTNTCPNDPLSCVQARLCRGEVLPRSPQWNSSTLPRSDVRAWHVDGSRSIFMQADYSKTVSSRPRRPRTNLLEDWPARGSSLDPQIILSPCMLLLTRSTLVYVPIHTPNVHS